jgi:hypothetical protein
MDYFKLVKTITPGRCSSVHYVEHKQIWGEFTYAPIYSIHMANFWKVQVRPDTVDLRECGRLDYWIRLGSTFCPASVSCKLQPAGVITGISYHFFNGLFVESESNNTMIEVKSPDKEIFSYCLAGFLMEYLSFNYTLRLLTVETAPSYQNN